MINEVVLTIFVILKVVAFKNHVFVEHLLMQVWR